MILAHKRGYAHQTLLALLCVSVYLHLCMHEWVWLRTSMITQVCVSVWVWMYAVHVRALCVCLCVCVCVFSALCKQTDRSLKQGEKCAAWKYQSCSDTSHHFLLRANRLSWSTAVRPSGSSGFTSWSTKATRGNRLECFLKCHAIAPLCVFNWRRLCSWNSSELCFLTDRMRRKGQA